MWTMKSVMMKYGSGKVEISVPEEDLIGVIEKDVPPAHGTEEDLIREALAHPIGTPGLADIVRPGQTVAIVVSDITRLWHRPYVFLPLLVDALNQAGIPDADIRFVGAVGLHRKQSADEHARILGPALATRFAMEDHDSRDDSGLVFLGTTTRGTPVRVNKTAMSCDHVILTGRCTYHPFFGWGGGKKSVLPGIAGFETVQANHRMVMADEVGAGQFPEARNGNIKGNRVYDDAVEAAAMVRPSFLLNVVMGYDGRIARAVAGHWLDAHEAGCRMVEELYGVPIHELSDLTIVSQGGFPKDIEFYQTGKAFYGGQDSVKPGGTLLVLSECREGLGPEEARRIFLDLDTTEAREKDVRALFSVPRYVCWYMCAAAEKYDIIVVSSIDPALLAKTRIRVVKTVEEGLALIRAERGEHLRTWLMPLGSSVLPIYDGD